MHFTCPPTSRQRVPSRCSNASLPSIVNRLFIESLIICEQVGRASPRAAPTHGALQPGRLAGTLAPPWTLVHLLSAEIDRLFDKNPNQRENQPTSRGVATNGCARRVAVQKRAWFGHNKPNRDGHR